VQHLTHPQSSPHLDHGEAGEEAGEGRAGAEGVEGFDEGKATARARETQRGGHEYWAKEWGMVFEVQGNL
jgi:hypothetical protein